MINKCLFPAAGYGTRFLPATKAVPKEMLPILTKPLLQYGVEEALNAGITNMAIVTGRGKRAIEDHFDNSFELESQLIGTSKEYLLNEVNKLIDNSEESADVLYKRGSSYERLGDEKNSDKDLLKSLSIKPDDPYVLNYLAYSWLERGYKIQDAIRMLDKAYNQKKSDPFIIDSVGWGYYLIGDYINAENFLRKAIQLMPKDPIVNDHYGDVLWKLNRKIQAKYYWESALNSEDTENIIKENISKKLLKGLNES